MNFCMKQKQYYTLIISLLFTSLLPAQNVTDLIMLANEQYARGEYDLAAREYNRALFFEGEPADLLSLQIAHCYANQGHNGLAVDFYNKAYSLSKNDSLKNEALLGSAFCFLVQEKHVLALSELFNMSEEATPNQNIRMHFLKGLAHYWIGDDTLALAELQQSMQLAGTSDLAASMLADEFEKVFSYPKRYRSKRAYVMSGIVPGSGQLSVGAVREGINSMLLIGGLYLVALQVVKHYSFLDAAIALFPWVQRYYLGGMDKAKNLAIERMEEKRHASYLKILEISTPDSYQ